MRGRVIKVRTRDGQAAHRELVRRGWFDETRRPATNGEFLLLPITSNAPGSFHLGLDHDIMEAALEKRKPRPRSLREALSLSEDTEVEVTRSMDIVGDIAVIRLKDDLRPRAEEIGRALRVIQPRLKAVAVDDGVKGEHRVRALTIIAGEGPLVTMHREYGLTLRVDLEHAYFSPRLATEHNRVANMVGRGERLLDMFTGVGPFAILAAKAGRTGEVHAIDINQRAVELARENAERNGVGHLVHFHQGDAREVVPGLGRFDRIVMNHPHGARDFLDVALRACRDEGVIHLHTIGRPDEAFDVMEEVNEQADATGHAGARLSRTREVRTYAPGVSHFCLDIVVVG